jgi:nucleoside-diphosphate kinase
MATTRTLALIKPDAFPSRAKIIELIKAAGFTIVVSKELSAPKERLGEFYQEHRGRSFFEELTTFMASGPFVALVLEKVDAVPEWRRVIGISLLFLSNHIFLFTLPSISYPCITGPTNTFVAKETEPECLRAKFGTDLTKNACHGSANAADAAREISFFFPDL